MKLYNHVAEIAEPDAGRFQVIDDEFDNALSDEFPVEPLMFDEPEVLQF